MKTRCLSKPVTALLTAVFLAFGFAVPTAWAQLPGSEFEIEDGNLKYDSLYDFDWGNVSEDRAADLPSGSTDDSFTGGSKEDTPVPSISTGSIPPNKSDLKNFGIYLEENTSGRYLHMYWTRVQDPSGTTLMDFEFNQSETVSANGVTPVRTSGDLLVMYELAQGGKVPDIFVSEWLEPGDPGVCEAAKAPPCWSERVNLSAFGAATGSINEALIPAADADGLGQLDPYTFGEASIDFVAIVGANECVSYGSAHLKSRSSDSFTATLKDFIAPLATDISNCGTIKVLKVDDTPASEGGPLNLAGAVFELRLTETGAKEAQCTTDSNGVCQPKFENLLQGTTYWVCETVAPAGHNLASPACQSTTVTADEEVTLTFIDPRKPAKVTILKTDDASPPNLLVGASFQLYTDAVPLGSKDVLVTGKSCTTNASGYCEITDILPPGNYCVSETTTPAGYDTAADQCFSLVLDQTKALTFVDPRQRGAILITKVRKHAASSITPPAVTFEVSGGSLTSPVQVSTGSADTACVDNLVLSSLAGQYSVQELATGMGGYAGDVGVTKTVSVTAVGTCSSGSQAGVTFTNKPKTNVTVSVDSQVPGGTSSVITCTGVAPYTTPASGDGSVNVNDVTIPDGQASTTITCTIVIDP